MSDAIDRFRQYEIRGYRFPIRLIDTEQALELRYRLDAAEAAIAAARDRVGDVSGRGATGLPVRAYP